MDEVTISNWRQAPYNVWAFRHIDQIITTERIYAGKSATLPQGELLDTLNLNVELEERRLSFEEVMNETDGDALLVLRGGNIIHESYRQGDATARHILFSVSKSITGILAGVLVESKNLDPDAPVTQYVPEVSSTSYGSATVRHLLDMTVNITFIEDYLDKQGAFARYRAATGWNSPNSRFKAAGLHDFLTTLPPASGQHGEIFHYVSPNSDLLGWILERAGGDSFAALMTRLIWQPMGAEADCNITVDGFGAPRTAGGICATLRDLARFGEMIRRGGRANDLQVIPKAWIDDIWKNGNADAWQRGSMVELFPRGRYRSQWYLSDDHQPALCAIGIHGQWIYIDSAAEIVIAKQSSQKIPLDYRIDRMNLALFQSIVRSF